MTISPVGEIGSVMVAELDEEHEQCAAALNQLALSRDAASLHAVHEAYKAHFANEERLLDLHLYAEAASMEGSGACGFSADAGARKSHFSEHKRMLDQVAHGLSETKQRKDGAVPAALVQLLLRNFEDHASKYDINYAKPLSSSIAMASSG